MRIVYAAMPVSDLSLFSDLPYGARVCRNNRYNISRIVSINSCARRFAKELFEIFIKDLQKGCVQSYDLFDNADFPFPDKKPRVKKPKSVKSKDLWTLELHQLYTDPKKKLKEFKSKLEADLKGANDDQILEMVERFHYISSYPVWKDYQEELATVRKLWKPCEEIIADIESFDITSTHVNLARALNTIDNQHIRNLRRQLQKARELLSKGKRKEVVKMVKDRADNWMYEKYNLVPFYNTCRLAQTYHKDLWIARIVSGEGKIEYTHSPDKNDPKTHEEALENSVRNLGFPYQIVEVDIRGD